MSVGSRMHDIMSQGPPEQSTSRTIGSLEKSLNILEELLTTRDATVSEIATAVEMSPASVHHHLATLEARGYVENEGGTYRLGIQFLPLGGAARFQREIYQISRDAIEDLAHDLDATARLVVEDRGYGITVYNVGRAGPSREEIHLGTREYLHGTAAGKALLAEFSPERRRRIFDSIGLPQLTENTITDRQSLESELITVEAQGTAFDREESFDGIICVARAITTEQGDPVGAISVSDAIDDRDQEWFFETAAEAVKNKAGVIQLNITYSDWA